MDIANNEKPRRLRIIAGRPQTVELELNGILDDYAPMVWNCATVGDHMELAVVCVSISEIRKGQLAMGGGGKFGG